jgi:arylsulfatase
MMEDYGLPGYRGDLNQNCVTMAEALKPAGYTTLMAGKWHVTPAAKQSKENWPRQRGFDRFFGTIHGAGSFYDPPSLTRENEPVTPDSGFYYTDAISAQAVDYIDEYSAGESPFFMYVPYTSPHWPLHAREADIAKYRGRYEMGWDELRESRRRRMIEMGLVEERWPLTPRDPRVPAWADAANKEWEQRRMEVYAAQVDVMDQGIGRIVSKLEEKGVLDDTLILFLADNGGCAEELDAGWKGLHIPTNTLDGRPVLVGNDPAVMPGPEATYQSYGVPWANASNTPFRLYKHWVHEGGISTPLIAHWPKAVTKPNSLSREPGHLIDIMATCVDVAGAEYPAEHNGNAITPLEGKPLTPVIRGGEREPHEAIFWEHEGNRAVRQGKWKLVSRWNKEDGGRWELYDLEADRTEMDNLAGANPDRVTAMEKVYDVWAARSQVAPWRSWEQTD